MKSVSGKELARLLKKKGWELKRIKGSHHVYVRPGNPARISIPVHGKRPLKVGLLKHIMKLAKILEDELWRGHFGTIKLAIENDKFW